MPMIRALRLLNAIEAGTTTGAQLQALLSSDPVRAGEFSVLLGLRGQIRRMLASSVTMAALFASPIAMAALVSNPASLLLVATDGQYGPSLANNVAAKMAIFNSDTALNALLSSENALQNMRAGTQYSVRAPNAAVNAVIPNTVAGGSYIVLGLSTTATTVGASLTLNTLRPGSNISNISNMDGTSSGTSATYYPKAIPLVANFTASQNAARQWYIGMLRCDV